MRHIFEDFRRALELNRQNDKKGFSLIELLVVIAIIAILAAIAIPQYNKYRANAMLSNVQGLAKSLANDALALATTSAQNPDIHCRFADNVTVVTKKNQPTGSTTTATSDKCSGGKECFLVALGNNSQTICDYNTEELPAWVETAQAGLKIKIYGTNATIESGNVTVLSSYTIGNNKKIGCIYYPSNDTMADASTTYVCKTF